jgi:hypothetical protein
VLEDPRPVDAWMKDPSKKWELTDMLKNCSTVYDVNACMKLGWKSIDKVMILEAKKLISGSRV